MWKAVEVVSPGIPEKHSWVVEYDDGTEDCLTVKVGRFEDDNQWLGLTEEDAEHLAFVLNGYDDDRTIEPGEWN